jgi:ureidoglycolate lyase
MARIELQAMSAAAFAPFGKAIDIAERVPETINDGSTQRYAEIAHLDVRDPVLGIYVAQARNFPLALEKLERHRLAEQAFIPLGPHRFVIVVAPGIGSPEWDAIRAFVTAPGQGVVLRRGCWHHGLIALGDGDRFAVIEGGSYREDTREAAAPRVIELAVPPDLR